MFKDYYKILEIDNNVSLQEVKAAFRIKAIQWHPDKNLDKDTTREMQEINEAYLILKDFEARERYNIEYAKYISSHKKKVEDYPIEDEILHNWMKNAEKQSTTIVDEIVEDLQGMLWSGLKNLKGFVFSLLLLGLISIILFAVLF